MNDTRHRKFTAALNILRDPEGRVLFMRRKNTGYMDGKLGLPAGGVEINETFKEAAIRELREEAGVSASIDNLDHVLTSHRYGFSGTEDYVDIFYEVSDWEGYPVITEPEKCSEIVWAKPEDVFDQCVENFQTFFEAIEQGETLVEITRSDEE